MDKEQKEQQDISLKVGTVVTYEQMQWLLSRAENEDRSVASIVRQAITRLMFQQDYDAWRGGNENIS
jgi:hypothetical protein